jgi:hypothetical protein
MRPYLVGCDECLEYAIEFGRRHVLLILAVILDDLRKSGFGGINIVNEILHLITRFANKVPHLPSKLAIVCIRKVFSQLFT